MFDVGIGTSVWFWFAFDLMAGDERRTASRLPTEGVATKQSNAFDFRKALHVGMASLSVTCDSYA